VTAGASVSGSGFSVSALCSMRQLLLGYPELLPIRHAPRDEWAPGSRAPWCAKAEPEASS